MSSTASEFVARYGPWALVAGASEGIGEAFARNLARRGLDLILVARRPGPLDRLASDLQRSHGVQTRTLDLDLGGSDAVGSLESAVRDLEVGLLVYNAAVSVIAPFLEQQPVQLQAAVDVNVSGPLQLSRLLAGPMARRGRGGIVLMSSMSGLQGTAMVTAYAATKAFNLVLAEGLWEELRDQGVDVLGCCAGPTATPGYLSSRPDTRGALSVPVQDPDDVAREALDALGSVPSMIPGAANRLSALVMQRLLPRSRAVRIMGRAMRRMYRR